ncbi:MAG: transketolase [Propionibacteriales bacterium]|nr:transketolase [Propionibacteriales bacterium]
MDMRTQFGETMNDLLDTDPSTALVLAEISRQMFERAIEREPDRVINVGIREQLLVSTAAGLALTGLRPVAHTFGAFLVERAFEQVKLDFSHQDVGGVLVSAGGSFDWPAGGYTHMSPGDVALLDTLPGWTVHVPGRAEEADRVLRDAVAGTGRVYIRLSTAANRVAVPSRPGRFQVVRRGVGGTVLAVGPTLDAVLAATQDRDVTVLYATTVRPFDAQTLRATLGRPAVAVVEPYLAGTSARQVSDALRSVPHRLLGLGVGSEELRRYGTPREHERAHGLDAASLRRSLDDFLLRPAAAA